MGVGGGRPHTRRRRQRRRRRRRRAGQQCGWAPRNKGENLDNSKKQLLRSYPRVKRFWRRFPLRRRLSGPLRRHRSSGRFRLPVHLRWTPTPVNKAQKERKGGPPRVPSKHLSSHRPKIRLSTYLYLSDLTPKKYRPQGGVVSSPRNLRTS